MTPPTGDRALHNERKINESYELVTRYQEIDSNVHKLDGDLNPDSDASLLRRHFASSNESHGSLPRTQTPVGLFRRFTSFMSRTPLLWQSSPAQGTGSYGALPVQDLILSTDASENEEEDIDDIRRRDRRKGRGSGLRQVETNDSSRSRRTGASNTGSAATRKVRLRESKSEVDPTLPTVQTIPTGAEGVPFGNTVPDTNGVDSVSENSEEDAGAYADSDDDGLSVEDPPDNSPLVKFVPGSLFKSGYGRQSRCFLYCQLCLQRDKFCHLELQQFYWPGGLITFIIKIYETPACQHL